MHPYLSDRIHLQITGKPAQQTSASSAPSLFLTNCKGDMIKPRGGLVDRAFVYEREPLGFDPVGCHHNLFFFFHFITLILLLDVEKVG